MHRGALLWVLGICSVGWSSACSQPPQTTIRLDDVLSETGIDFVHTDGASGRRYVVEAYTAGLAIFDYDGDGFQDIYFVNGAPLPGTTSAGTSNALYKNNGDWTFSNATRQANVVGAGYGLGVVAGDFDNDGDPDLYVTNYGPNTLYVNNGDGTFTDGTRVTGVSAGDRFGAGATFFDMDADGDLDLYCANYQKFTFDQHIVRMIGPYQFHPGPGDYPPEDDNLFLNGGDGTFTDVSQSRGITATAGTGMGVIASDLDDDGDSDILVANDGIPNFLFLNDGTGNFREEGVLAGIAYDRSGRANGNMGVDCADVDGDGLIDILTTTYQDEMPVLYRNSGAGIYDDATNVSRIDRSLVPHVNWGVGLIDLDNDADRDIFIACGHFMDNIRFIDDRTDMQVINYLLENDGSGRFGNVTSSAGSGLEIVDSSRGAAFDDLDNDGDIDVVVTNFNGPPTILRNETTPLQNWIDVHLVGRSANRQGIGARVSVKSGRRTQHAEVYAGRGYQSHYGTRLHFGLGSSEQVDEIRVRWSGTDEETFRVDAINTIQVLQQGTSHN